MDAVRGFLGDIENNTKIRYIGFTMAVVVMLVGIAAVVVAIVTVNGILGGVAAATIMAGFVTLPVTDLNFPSHRGYY